MKYFTALRLSKEYSLASEAMPASMNGRPFQAPPAVGQSLPPAYTAELSEDGEIFDSDDDDDLPFVRADFLALQSRQSR
jgi:hypothetical protein